MTDPRSDSGGSVAVVLSGAAARGAFQAGALGVLLPALEQEGLRPTVWLGTSAGSINATLYAAAADRGVADAAAHLAEVWRSMGQEDVYRPLVPFGLLRTGVPFAAGALLGLGPGITSLLDTAPLRRTAEALLDTERAAAAVRSGLLRALGVVATRVPTDGERAASGREGGRSVLFLDEHEPSGYAGDDERALDVQRGPIEREHVLASSAIPAAFPAVHVQSPATAAGWYVDGGVRLNAPLHPAVGLGADRVLVVSATATTYAPLGQPDPAAEGPDVADALAQALDAVLGDRLVEDLRSLRRINRFLDQGAGPLLRGDGGHYRRIPVMAVAPRPGEMARAAAETYARRTQGAGRLREWDNWLLGRLLRGTGDSAGRLELLSYLLFDEEYFAAGVELGAEAGRRALAAGWT